MSKSPWRPIRAPSTRAISPTYLRAGVNRLSIGVQSLSAPHLVALGRIHDPSQALAAYATARQVGCDNVNLDMMFGLPRQTIDQARDDLARLIDLQPEHLSYYQLTMEPNTAFAQSPPAVADDDQLCDMQEQGIALLAAAGYRRYEISAYAREDRVCRHNLNYWRFGDYLGIGAGAHGKLTHVAGGAHDGQVERRSCRRHPDAYIANADRLSSRRWLSDQDLILEFALNAFRLVDGVESALFERHTGLPLTCLDADSGAGEAGRAARVGTGLAAPERARPPLFDRSCGALRHRLSRWLDPGSFAGLPPALSADREAGK